MGNHSQYIPGPDGLFKESHYTQFGDTIVADGLSGKIIVPIIPVKDNHYGLPLYAGKSKIYFKIDGQDKVEQMRIYINRKAAIDFDWGHKDGKFKKGVVHVHLWVDGKRQPPRRLMNNHEMKMYGKLLKKANPNVRFR